MRLKDISQLTPQYKGKAIDGNVSFVPMESLRNGNIDLKEISYAEGKGKYTYFGNGDLLIAKVTPCFENGNIAIAENLKEGIGFGSSEIFVLRTNSNVNNKYLFYLSQSSNFQDAACATMCGVGGLKRISPNIMRTYEFVLPSIDEQTQAVNYLDKKLDDIDKHILLQERKKSSYNQLKTSLIYTTVTKGLNSNCNLKDSNVSWIGNIPNHWDVKRGKDKLCITNGFPADSNLFDTEGDGIPLIRIRDINNNNTEVVYKGTYPELYLIKKNDILIGMDGDFNIAKWRGSAALLNQRVCKISSKSMNEDYIYYCLAFPLKEINGKKVLTTVKHLSSSDLGELSIPIPPIDEQISIAAFLNTKCSEIERVIKNIDNQIEALKALKKSLINEVITGKRAV